MQRQPWAAEKISAQNKLVQNDTGARSQLNRKWEGKDRTKTIQTFKANSNPGSIGALKKMNPIPWCAFKGVICHAYCCCFNVVYWLAAHLHQGEVLERFQAMLKWVLCCLLSSTFLITALAPGALSWHADVKDADSAAFFSLVRGAGDVRGGGG